MQSRHVLREGMCYRVGIGLDIAIWRDPWLPTLEGFVPIARKGVDTSDLVSIRSLMLNESRCWNSSLVRHVFSEASADAILNLCLSEGEARDSLFWPLEDSGEFSVKSAYSAIVKCRRPQLLLFSLLSGVICGNLSYMTG